MGVSFQFGCCGLVALLGAIAVVTGIAYWRKGKKARAGVTAGCGCLAALASVAWIAMWVLAMNGSESTNRRVFESVFGFEAPETVTEVRSFSASSTDWFLLCLTFTADQETLRSAIESAGFVSDATPVWPECDRDLAWWNPAGNISTWSKEPFYETSYGGGRATLACPKEGGTCYLVASGVE